MSKKTQTRGAIALLAVGALAAATSAAQAQTVTTTTAAKCSYVFNTNLTTGSRSTDVMNLQKVLNMNPATTVATTGSGSMGNETTFFGAATKAAVIKYQKANGITPAAGFVGALTRASLNQVCTGTGSTTGSTTGTTTTSAVQAVLSANQPNGVLVTGQSAARLADITLTGNGTVTAITAQRGGVSSNDLLQNVYLYEGATRVSDGASVNSSGAIVFSGLNIQVAGSKTLSVRADIAANTNSVTYTGQFVNVTVTGVTANGTTSAASLTGNTLSVSTVNTATLAITNNSNNQVSPGTSVNAGTQNQVLFTANFNVGTRDAIMKALAFRYTGSAAASAVSNLSLYVDGVKVGTSVINTNTNYVTFDMTSAPVTLKAGNRTVELRGDIVGGSDRYFQFSLENKADVIVEDSSLVGVSVNNGITSSLKGTYVAVKTGNLVISQDSTFTNSTVVGAASNIEVGRFTIAGYGESTKIETLALSFSGTGASTTSSSANTATLQNVTLYANGAQIGSTQNWTGSTMTFNLGSSLILTPGQTVTLSVKTDLRNTSGTDVTSGSITASIVSASSVARAQTSYATVTVPSATGKAVTVGTANVTVSKTAGFVNQTVSPNTSAVKIGSVTVQASDSEDVTVTNLAVNVSLTGTAVASDANLITNLRVTPSGNTYTTLSGTAASDYNFSMSDSVVRNTAKTYDVYADIGSVTAGTIVNLSAKATTRGASSGVNNTSALTTSVASTVNTATLSAPTLVSSSPVQQLVVGESTGNIATFNIKASNGTATIQELGFAVSDADVITSITVGGVTKGVTTTGSTKVTGLNISVPNGNAGVDLPVTVTYGKIASANGVSSQTTAATTLTLNYIKATSGNNTLESGVTAGFAAVSVASNAMQAVASKPTVTVANTSATGLNLTAENKVGEVTVAADAKGNIAVNAVKFAITNSGFTTAPTALTGVRLADGSTTISGVTCTATGVTEVNCVFSSGYTITAGTSKTFSLYAAMTGAANTGSNKAQISTKLSAGSDFKWVDINGSTSELTGANVYNFPTTSYTISQ